MAINNLSKSDIEEIKKMLKQGFEQRLIAIKYKIPQSDVSKIKTGTLYDKKYSRLYLCSVSETTKNILKNIALNKGYKDYPEYVKFELRKIIENTPEHLKQKPLDD
jgi:hypothetical protein